MTYPQFLAGQVLTPDDLGGMQWRAAGQGENQVVSNSATLVDSNIAIPVQEGGRYWVHLRGRAAAASTADLQLGWSMPSGSTILRTMWGGGEDATGGPTGWTTAMFRSAATDAGLPYGMSGTGAPRPFFEDVDLVAGDDGDLVLRFAQATAHASNCTLYAVSYARWLRIAA